MLTSMYEEKLVRPQRNKSLDMNKARKKITDVQRKRMMRVRKKTRGTAQAPRMSVVKSNCHISVQVIDDVRGVTIASISTMSEEVGRKKSKESGRMLGEIIGKKLNSLGIERIVFDRGPFKYHGILHELAEAARAQGIRF